MNLLLGFILAGLPLALVEFWSRKIPSLPPEFSRKFIHVSSSLASIALALFLDLHTISIIGFSYAVLLLALRHNKIWKSLYGIKRFSYGEIAFPIGVGTAALIATSAGMYIAGILIMGLSDTIASIVGQHFNGKTWRYFPKKTIVGSSGFFVATVIILATITDIPGIEILFFSIILTFAELASIDGFDNAILPPLAVLLLMVSQ